MTNDSTDIESATGAAARTTRAGAESNGTADPRRAYRARIDAVVDYVWANLDGDLSVETLAAVACFSPFHFHRQFRAFAGIGIGRLVRLLRLRRAALRLAFDPALTITEIALASGFNSTESFGRAFRRLHGCAPGEFRRAPRWSASPIGPVLVQIQESRMNRTVEIVEFPTTRVAAVEYQGPHEREYEGIMRLVAWRRTNGVGPGRGMTIGIHHSDPYSTPPDEYRIDLCVSHDGEIGPNEQGVVAKEIPGGRCARIRHIGTREHIPEAEFIYREWLPASGERLREFPPFFHYVNVGPDVRDEEMITDVYLPLV